MLVTKKKVTIYRTSNWKRVVTPKHHPTSHPFLSDMILETVQHK